MEKGSPVIETLSVGQLLDALPDATAVVDSRGTITATNRAWDRFAADNGGDADRTGVGVDYLAVCARSAATGCADAAAVEAELRAVLQGTRVESQLHYRCDKGTLARWFSVRVSAIAGEPGGALVAHIDISRQKTAELDLEAKAARDPLTGLANRARFIERLESALRPRKGRDQRADVGVLYIDLDHFKPVNDGFGHAAGDQVLQAVADRLQRVLRPQDTVARLGGDEFGVVVPRITAEQLTALSDKIRGVLDEPHLVDGRPAGVRASVGGVLASPGEQAAQVLHRADGAMYAAKQRNRPADYTGPERRQRDRERQPPAGS